MTGSWKLEAWTTIDRSSPLFPMMPLGTCHLCCCQRKVHSCRGDQCPCHGCRREPASRQMQTGATMACSRASSSTPESAGRLFGNHPHLPSFRHFFLVHRVRVRQTGHPQTPGTCSSISTHGDIASKEGGLKESTKRRRCNVVSSRDGRGIPWNTQHAFKKPPLLSDPPAVGTARIPHQQRHPSQPSDHPLCRHCWPAPHARA